ncbi:MAG: hypothetical protein N3F05_00305 [Candidatus Diapherotrites archaeon]|nr:hypothetical protein [Candidatus Diapherotrites archaeon]
MLKKVIFAFLLFLCLDVAASVIVNSPYEAVLEKNGLYEAKYAQPGENVVFIFDRKSPNSHWDYITVKSAWPNNAQVIDKTIRLVLTVPLHEKIPTVNNTEITLKDGQTGVEESFNLAVYVRNDLIKAGLNVSHIDCNVNSGPEFELVITNESLAEHTVEITSSLPETWFSTQRISLAPKSSKTITLKVNAFTPGYKRFTFTTKSALSGTIFSQAEATMKVAPALGAKYTTAIYSMPFFSISLLPGYLLNSLLGSFLIRS